MMEIPRGAVFCTIGDIDGREDGILFDGLDVGQENPCEDPFMEIGRIEPASSRQRLACLEALGRAGWSLFDTDDATWWTYANPAYVYCGPRLVPMEAV